MINKSYSSTGKKCRVLFKLMDIEAETVSVLGEFNNWDPDTHPMKQRRDGSWSTQVSLDADTAYRFKYLIDYGKESQHWVNDAQADELVFNEHGTQDGLLRL